MLSTRSSLETVRTNAAIHTSTRIPRRYQPYWTLASEYTLAEHLFTTQGSGSFIAHQDLIRGGTIVEPNKAMVDDPTTGDTWWGCNASPGTITHLITKANVFIQKGPFPCSNKFRDAYPTLRDLLDAKKVSWKYYVPPSSQIDGRYGARSISSTRFATGRSGRRISRRLRRTSSATLPAASWPPCHG